MIVYNKPLPDEDNDEGDDSDDEDEEEEEEGYAEQIKNLVQRLKMKKKEVWRGDKDVALVQPTHTPPTTSHLMHGAPRFMKK